MAVSYTHLNGRKERTHAKNEQETAAGMVFFPAASESWEYHLRPYHIQRPLPGLYPCLLYTSDIGVRCRSFPAIHLGKRREMAPLPWGAIRELEHFIFPTFEVTP